MMRRILVAATALAAFVAAPAAKDRDDRHEPIGSFRPLATFNVPGATTSEIVSATPDGKFLVYSDAIGEKFGLVDIRNPSAPAQVATVAAGGSPTSVVALPDGRHALGCVQPGKLVLIDLATFTIVAVKAIGEGPDSIAVTTIGGQLVAVIAIENEGDLPKGYVEVVRVTLADFAASPSATVRFDDPAVLAAEGLIAIDDPQPEFISLRGTKAAVTLQENNGIAIIDLSNPAAPVLDRLFSTGVVDDRPADVSDDSRISFTDSYPSSVAGEIATAGTRIPDAIGWSSDGKTLFTADEGEEAYEGGRGWSAHSADGSGPLYDDGGTLEQTAVRFGHYPDGRSDAKGIEAEGLATAKFGLREFLFVSSERGAFVAVYRVGGDDKPRFVQLLSTGPGPEGVLPIPGRGLLVTANEGDDGDGSISIFEGVPGKWEPSPNRPIIESRGVDEPWGALSGLTSHLYDPRVLYAVPDDALPSSIFRIIVGAPEARIYERVPVTREGTQATYDLEGITVDTSIAQPHRSKAGFWLASEGNASSTRNTLVQVDSSGRVLREVFLPAAIDGPGGRITSNGLEGVAVSCDGRHLVVAVQRPFTGDVAVGGVAHTRIARYDLKKNTWDAFFYPLVNSPGTIGLSEITVLGCSEKKGDLYGVIERDNRLAANANIKRIYAISLEGATPVDISTLASAATIPDATVAKQLVRDVLPLFTPYEKVEGLTTTVKGDLWVVLDNDGGEVESRLIRIK